MGNETAKSQKIRKLTNKINPGETHNLPPLSPFTCLKKASGILEIRFSRWTVLKKQIGRNHVINKKEKTEAFF